MNILMLEDEPLILMDLEFAAEDAGARPLCASSVREALSILQAEPVDSAILDVTLKDGETCVPVMNGASLTCCTPAIWTVMTRQSGGCAPNWSPSPPVRQE
jgi:CheY-like chemotaxis protein